MTGSTAANPTTIPEDCDPSAKPIAQARLLRAARDVVDSLRWMNRPINATWGHERTAESIPEHAEGSVNVLATAILRDLLNGEWKRKIQIGISTSHASVDLQRCVNSIAKLELPEDSYLSIIVMERDELSIGVQMWCKSLSKEHAIPISYNFAPSSDKETVQSAIVEVAKKHFTDDLFLIDDTTEIDPKTIRLVEIIETTTGSTVVHEARMHIRQL